MGSDFCLGSYKPLSSRDEAYAQNNSVRHFLHTYRLEEGLELFDDYLAQNIVESIRNDTVDCIAVSIPFSKRFQLSDYDRLIGSILSKGKKAVVYLVFDAKDGNNSWLDLSFLKSYLSFCESVIDRYQKKVAHYITFTTLNLYAWLAEKYLQEKIKVSADYLKQLVALSFQLHLINARAVAYGKNRGCSMGTEVVLFHSFGKSDSSKDQLMVHDFMEFIYSSADLLVNGSLSCTAQTFLERYGLMQEPDEKDREILKAGKVDFLGICYYRAVSLGTDSLKDEQHLKTVESKYENPFFTDYDDKAYDYSFRLSMLKTWERYHIPLLIRDSASSLHSQDCRSLIQNYGVNMIAYIVSLSSDRKVNEISVKPATISLSTRIADLLAMPYVEEVLILFTHMNKVALKAVGKLSLKQAADLIRLDEKNRQLLVDILNRIVE